ncbi:hypothetical protein [Longibacter sp.]|uniref:hypothetical protein n=1 Tax=Longibacter sp. TaxID=2045415 RepID=UPI003EB71D8E
MSDPVFQTFWYGSELGPRETLCLTSFVERGASIEVYTFDPDLTVPDGVVRRDASELYDEDDVFFYEKGIGQGNVAAFSNLFRYRLLYERGGWWVDADILYTGEAVPEVDVFAGWETDGSICNAILKFPAGSTVMRDCMERAGEMGGDVTWGEAGPALVTKVLREHGRMDVAAPVRYAYPVPWQEAPSLYVPDRRQEIEKKVGANSSPFVHFWNSILRLAGFQPSIAPPRDSYAERQARALGCTWTPSEPRYEPGAVQRMADNYRLVRNAKPMKARLRAIEGSRSWKAVSTLRSVLGREPIGGTT